MRIGDKQQFITADKSDKAIGSKKTDAKTRTAEPSTQTTGDKLMLSATSKDIAEITLQLRDASEVREELVNQLKEKIMDGSYNIAGRDIAARVMAKAENNDIF
jgi:negative regulator of flagellin synthesis FlgM